MSMRQVMYSEAPAAPGTRRWKLGNGRELIAKPSTVSNAGACRAHSPPLYVSNHFDNAATLHVRGSLDNVSDFTPPPSVVEVAAAATRVRDRGLGRDVNTAAI